MTKIFGPLLLLFAVIYIYFFLRPFHGYFYFQNFKISVEMTSFVLSFTTLNVIYEDIRNYIVKLANHQLQTAFDVKYGRSLLL